MIVMTDILIASITFFSFTPLDIPDIYLIKDLYMAWILTFMFHKLKYKIHNSKVKKKKKTLHCNTLHDT